MVQFKSLLFNFASKEPDLFLSFKKNTRLGFLAMTERREEAGRERQGEDRLD